MPVRVVAILAVAFATVAAGCSRSVDRTTEARPARYAFTCCRAADVDRTCRPGDVVHLHWIAQAGIGRPQSKPQLVVLNARLEGAFHSAADAKDIHHGTPVSEVRAASIRVTDVHAKVPNSVLKIPASARPGLYNLDFSIDSAGSTVAATTTIRVANA